MVKIGASELRKLQQKVANTMRIADPTGRIKAELGVKHYIKLILRRHHIKNDCKIDIQTGDVIFEDRTPETA